MDAPTVQVPIPPVAQPVLPPPKKKYYSLFIILALLAIILFTPIPYYQTEELICKPGQTCPKPGWHLNPPLLQSILRFFKTSSQSRSTRIGVPLTPTPTPDPTADWKSYSSALLSFKYPQGWEVKNSEGLSGFSNFHYFIDLKVTSYEYGPEPATMTISYWDNPQKLDIPDFQKQIQGKPIYKSAYTPSRIGQAVGYYTKEGFCEPVLCQSYTLAYNDKIYIVDIFQQSSDQDRQTINQILSTFTFIN